jgi:glycosyltransferase involved in cell wall biosynthesis
VHHGSIYSPWSNEVLESIMPVADKVVTVCPLVLQQQLAQGRDAVCIPNAIDPRRTASARKISKSKIRSQFDIPSDLKIALWCHRFSYEKRPDLAVVIGNALPDDWLLLMAGSGPYELLNWVSPKVRLLGPIDNPANLLSIADIFLSTGDAEGFGLAMGEAMLSDIPVVATPLGIAADPQLAHQVPVDASIDDWVTAIVKASLSDPSLATVARHLAERRYGFGQHLAAWTNVINEVFAGPAISN